MTYGPTSRRTYQHLTCDSHFPLLSRFKDSILTLCQMNMTCPEGSPTQKWWQHFREWALSIMPVYFDQIRSSARSLYGFDPYKMEGSRKHDAIDLIVQDFLKRQEGHATAVLIILNNTDNSLPNFEHGYTNQRYSVKEREDILRDWPVCYYRRTTEWTTGISSIVKLGRSDVNSNKRTPESTFRRPLSNRKEIVTAPSVPAGHPLVDAQSWPFTEWKELTSVLVDGGSRNAFVTYKSSNFSANQEDGLHDVPPSTWPENDNGETPPAASMSQNNTAFHSISLTPVLWMVVAVSGTDGKWNLRRSRGLSDADIRTFLEGTARKLRMSSFFDNRNVELAKQDSKQPLKLPVEELDGDLVPFLKSVKETYGLRPQSPHGRAINKSISAIWYAPKF